MEPRVVFTGPFLFAIVAGIVDMLGLKGEMGRITT
jgi:hypothetical protein